jgi:hypothetical protein
MSRARRTGGTNPAAGVPPFEAYEPARWAMGDTRRFAERMNLIALEPRGELTSTGYALANPGAEYLILEPTGSGEPFTVELEPGRYAVEWFDVTSRESRKADALAVDAAQQVKLTSPFSNVPAVAYLASLEASQ